MTKADYDIINSCSNIAYKWFKVTEDAEDVMQEVFLSILKNYSLFEKLPEREKLNYTVRSIKNKIIDSHRRKTSNNQPLHKEEINYYVDCSSSETTAKMQTQPDVFAKMELEEILKKGKGNHCCDTLFLFAQGYTCRELSTQKNLNLNTVLGHCRYGRKFLKK